VGQALDTATAATRFVVERAVRGVDGTEVVVFGGPGSCALRFEAGRRYVVYARRQSGSLVSSICTRTAPIERAAEDLAYFDSLNTPGSGRISGLVREYRTDYVAGRDGWASPLARVPLTLTGAGVERRVTSGADGAFSFDDLRAGEYRLQAALPSQYVAAPELTRQLLSDRACASANVGAVLDGRVRGVVLNDDGTPASGVRVDAAASAALGQLVGARVQSATTDDSGTFEIHPLPPGTYIIGTNLGVRVLPGMRSHRRYYPGVIDPAAAQPVEMGVAQRVQLSPFKVPSLPTHRQVRGIVTWPDGRPAMGARITVMGVVPEDQITEDGRFALTLKYGAAYSISARLTVTVDGRHIAGETPAASVGWEDVDPVLTLVLRLR
jgi:hypothetical protein